MRLKKLTGQSTANIQMCCGARAVLAGSRKVNRITLTDFRVLKGATILPESYKHLHPIWAQHELMQMDLSQWPLVTLMATAIPISWQLIKITKFGLCLMI